MWNVEALTGYKPITTLWEDFSIADRFGEAAVRDTFDRAFEEWKTHHEYLTELVMVLNWKIWQWYQTGNEVLARTYDQLWEQASNWAETNLKGEELEYYFRVTD